MFIDAGMSVKMSTKKMFLVLLGDLAQNRYGLVICIPVLFLIQIFFDINYYYFTLTHKNIALNNLSERLS